MLETSPLQQKQTERGLAEKHSLQGTVSFTQLEGTDIINIPLETLRILQNPTERGPAYLREQSLPGTGFMHFYAIDIFNTFISKHHAYNKTRWNEY